MSHNVFNNLAKRFADFRCIPNPNMGWRADFSRHFTIKMLLHQAGKELFKCITSGSISFDNVPSWLSQKPEYERPRSKDNDLGSTVPIDGNMPLWPSERLEYERSGLTDKNAADTVPAYSSYWWFAIQWLLRNVSDSAIMYPMTWKFTKRGDRWESLNAVLIRDVLPRKSSDEKKRNFWAAVARVSEEACLYLAQHCTNAKPQNHISKSQELSSPFEIDYKRQTLQYDGHRIRFPGTRNWQVFLLLYEADGDVVTYKDIEEATSRPDCNVLVGELRTHLKSNAGEAIAKAIENQRGVGYYLDFESLRVP